MSKNYKESSIDSSRFAILFKMIKQIFEIKKVPFPWMRSINASICAGFPMIVSLLIGRLDLGLIGGVGGFIYLYVVNEPYAQRAKKIFIITIGISCTAALGSLVSPHPILITLIVGLIEALGTFIFGSLSIPGPAAIFFVVGFLMTNGMSVNPAAMPMRAAAVFLSGCFTWIVSMIGYFFNPYDPEIKAVRNVYLCLSEFSKAIGRKNAQNVQNRTVNTLRQAEQTLLAGYISWKNSFVFNRLLLINEHANKLFLEMLELSCDKSIKLPDEISDYIKTLSEGIDLKNREKIKMHNLNNDLDNRYNKLLEIIYDVEAIINLPITSIGHGVKISKPSLKIKFAKAFNKDSIVFVNSIRYGVILSISAIIAFSFPFTNPYWIPITCAAVMLGSTIISTFNRAIQRSVGTIIGLMFTIVIFKLEPTGFVIVIINMVLTAITQLLIVKNYAIACIFITANSFILAEAASKIHEFSYFATARITDIVIGSAIGLIGTYIIGHRSASSRLPDLMVKLVRSQSQVLVYLVNNKTNSYDNDIKYIKEKMNINLMNFKMAYETALGEIPNDRETLERMWPSVFSSEHITYLLDQYCVTKKFLNLSDDDLAKFLLAFEKIVIAIEKKQLIEIKEVPIIDEFPKLCKEINQLQYALSIKRR